jgi:RNA polymerase sigma factor for flagellar operon FliA
MRRVETLWAVYVATKSEEIRNELLEMYWPLAKMAAKGMTTMVPTFVSISNLEADAGYGLLQAIESFRPELGAAFITYAGKRMRGTMFDGLRDDDPATRYVRFMIRKMREIQERHDRGEGPPVTPEELSRVSGYSLEHCRNMRHIGPGTEFISIDMVEEGHSHSVIGESHARPAFIDPRSGRGYRDVVLRDFRQWLFDQIDRPEWKRILTLYFVDGKSHSEVGKEVGRTANAVGQVNCGRRRKVMAEDKKDAGKGARDDEMWSRGCEKPINEGPHEVEHMGRMILVRAMRGPDGEMRIYGVPGHMKEGLPWNHFNNYRHPRHVVGRRSDTSNLSFYDRALSRHIAGLTALRIAVERVDGGEIDALYEKWGSSQLDIHDMDSEIALSLTTAEDQEAVERAVEERLALWYREDATSLPLPSSGLGAPIEGEDINGQRVEQSHL